MMVSLFFLCLGLWFFFKGHFFAGTILMVVAAALRSDD